MSVSIKTIVPFFYQGLVILACQLISLSTAFADEPKPLADEKRKEIAQLIDQLASTNPEPVDDEPMGNEVGRHHSAFPAKWDEKKQKKVFESAAALIRIGMDAFPQLAAHFNDPRYSYSDESLVFDYYYKCNVGRLCQQIFLDQVDPHVSWQGPVKTDFGPTFNKHPPSIDPREFDKWWSKNSARPLWEIQADSLRWAIELESTVKIDDTDQAKNSADAQRQNKELLEKLLTTKKPINVATPKPTRAY